MDDRMTVSRLLERYYEAARLLEEGKHLVQEMPGETGTDWLRRVLAWQNPGGEEANP